MFSSPHRHMALATAAYRRSRRLQAGGLRRAGRCRLPILVRSSAGPSGAARPVDLVRRGVGPVVALRAVSHLGKHRAQQLGRTHAQRRDTLAFRWGWCLAPGDAEGLGLERFSEKPFGFPPFLEGLGCWHAHFRKCSQISRTTRARRRLREQCRRFDLAAPSARRRARWQRPRSARAAVARLLELGIRPTCGKQIR